MHGKPDFNISECVIDENVWTHLAIVKSLTELKIYKNGLLVKTRFHSNEDYWDKAEGNVYQIGRDNRSDTTSLNGMVSDFKIYDHCLSIQEIERDYSSLLIHYPLRDPYVESIANEPVYDCSGRGHDSVDRGNLIVKPNSSRNSYCTHFTPDNAIKIPSPYGSTTY